MKRSASSRLLAPFLGLGLLFLCAGWICLILLRVDFSLYIIYGCFAASFLSLFLALIFFLVSRKANRKEADAALNQLEAFQEGQTPRRELGKASMEVLALTHAINELPRQTASRELPQGILSAPEFEASLKKELALSTSIRSVLIVFGLQRKATPQSHNKLKEEVAKAYPKGLKGEVKSGIAVYLPVALSKAEEEGKAKAFVSSFVALENATSLSPTSIGAKAVLCFYPDYPAEELLETAMSRLEEADPLVVLSDSSAHLTPDTIGAEARQEESSYEDFALSLASSASPKDRKKALRLLLVRQGLGLGYDQVGLALFDASRNGYRLIEEIHQEGKGPSFKALAKEGFIKADRIDPYYDLALNERLFAVSDSLLLSSRPAAILDSLGLRSIACMAIGTGEAKLGFVYLTAEEPKEPLTPSMQASVKRFFLAARDFALLERSFAQEEESSTRLRLLTDQSGRYAYEIDPTTHQLLYLSHNLQEAYPKARLGMKCHKVLLGLDEPCPKCPLVDPESFKKPLAPLGPGLLSFTALSKVPKAMISLGKQEHSLTSRRLDQALYILNRRALMADLERELLDESEGCLLLFRVENALMSAGKIKGGTIDDVMSAVLSRLSLASLDEGLYRYDESTLGYLLQGTDKDEAFAVAVQVAEELSSPIGLAERDFVPELSYYLFAYPVEVSCNFDLESLMRTCSAKVANLGKGRVIPFDESEAPLVLPRSYKEDALKKALAKGSFPLSYTLIRENASLRPRYVELAAGLSLAKGERTSIEDVRGLVVEERIRTKLEEGELSSFLAAYKSHAKAFKASSLKGVVLTVSKASLFSPTYMRVLSRGLKDAGVPKGYVNLRFDGEILEEEKEKMEAALKALHEHKVNLIGRYDENSDSVIAYLGENELTQAMSTRPGKASLEARLAKAKADKVGLILPGINEDDERSYAISMAVPFGRGALYGEELEESAFFEAIA